MSRGRLLLEITRWELLRWLKLKDLAWTYALSTVFGLAVWGGLALFETYGREPVEIAVLHPEVLPFELPADSALTRVELAEADALAALERREIDAVLRLESPDAAELVVTREPVWKGELEAALADARRERKLAASRLDRETLADLFAPVAVEITYHHSAARPSTLEEKVTAGVLVGLMMLGTFLGLAYQLVVITGEKQLRVTEQIVSAVTPQTWIDGKILGISLLAFLSTASYVGGGLVFVLLSRLFGEGVALPLAIHDPALWVVLSLLALGGFLMWNTFFGLVAATIDDPNTSTRGAFMMLPALPLAAAALGLFQPDSALMRALSVLPPTSPAVLTLRLVLTEVPWWEVALALVLLAAAIWLLRRAAGKVFSLAILMYGKEPSWREIVRWIREA